MGCAIRCDRKGAACDNPDAGLVCDWTRMLLEQLEQGIPPEQAIRRCSATHYDLLGMEEILRPYVGRPEAFFQFIEGKWGWIITLDPNGMRLTADENKAECVCPLVRANVVGSPVLCACSEGFAEKMFSCVLQKQVKARVAESILRGGTHCVYEITWL